MYVQNCFIRKNTKELQNKLEELGYSICPCCNLKDSVWLSTFCSPNSGSLHGIGYSGEDLPEKSLEDRLNLFLKENTISIDCEENEELFLAIAALRNDFDKNQLFRYKETPFFTICNDNYWTYSEEWHKASATELMEYFKTANKIYE